MKLRSKRASTLLSSSIHFSPRAFAHDAISNHGLDEALDPGQVVGGAYVQIGGAVATYLTGRLTHSPRVATVGAELVRAHDAIVRRAGGD